MAVGVSIFVAVSSGLASFISRDKKLCSVVHLRLADAINERKGLKSQVLIPPVVEDYDRVDNSPTRAEPRTHLRQACVPSLSAASTALDPVFADS